MAELNSVTLTGVLLNTPTLHKKRRNSMFCQLEVEVRDRLLGAPPAYTWQEKTYKITVMAYGGTAIDCQKYLAPGDRIGVKGRLVQSDTGEVIVAAKHVVHPDIPKPQKQDDEIVTRLQSLE
jgi:single-stranded DNA-binding protein